MKRILIPILVMGILLVGACVTPTTPPSTEAPPTKQPTPITYNLSVSVSPSGAGSVSPSDGEYKEGTQVKLTASPTGGYTFDYWSGDASGSAATITITMDSNKSVTAYFKLIPEPELPTSKVEVQILEHQLVCEDYGSFSMTFIRGKLQNTGDTTLASTDVTIWVEYQVEGLKGRSFNQPGSIDLEPPAFKPGEIRDFEVLVQNGAKENYNISVSIMLP